MIDKTPLDVVSKKLTRKLWELTKWEDTYSFYSLSGEDVGWDIQRSHTMGSMILPAYDLGYLIRKLPMTVELERGHTRSFVLYKASDGGYVAGYQNVEDDGRVIRPTFNAVTPEDAVAELVIELFKNLGEKNFRGNSFSAQVNYVECEACAPEYRHCLKCERHREK